MRKTDLQDLLKTVETIRQELHPDLDAGFLDAVVRAEEQCPEDEEGAVRAIETALKVLLEGQGGN